MFDLSGALVRITIEIYEAREEESDLMVHTRGQVSPLESAIPTMLGGGDGEWLFWFGGRRR